MVTHLRVASVATFILVLIIGFTNCSEIKTDNLIFKSTQVGNPGEPPPPSAGKIRADLVKNLLKNICQQQKDVGLVLDTLNCVSIAESDDSLARELYTFDPSIRMQSLLNPNMDLRPIFLAQAELCVSSVLNSSLGSGGAQTGYSSETAQAVLQATQACESFFIPNAPSASLCLTTDEAQDGSSSKPWQISTCQCLQEIQTLPRDSEKSDFFLIVNDIDCAQVDAPNAADGFVALDNLTGQLDGNGFTVRNISVGRQWASVFTGTLGALKNIYFHNLLISSVGPNGIASLVIRSEAQSGPETHFDRLRITSSEFTADSKTGRAMGIANYLVGSIKQSAVTDTRLSGGKVAGLVGTLLSLRATNSASSQLSEILNSEFVGTLDGQTEFVGLVNSNLGGRLSSVEAQVNISQTGSDYGYVAAGLVGENTWGGLVEESNVSGDIRLNHSVLSLGPNPFTFVFGGLVGKNSMNEAPNATYSASPGVVRNSSSGLNLNITISRGAGAGSLITIQVDPLIGYSVGGVANGNVLLPSASTIFNFPN